MRELCERGKDSPDRIPMGSFGKRQFWPTRSQLPTKRGGDGTKRKRKIKNIIIGSGEVGCRTISRRHSIGIGDPE